MPRNGNLQKPMTVERALAEAHKAGCVFRLAGAGIDVRGINGVPADIVTFLRANRELVFDHLGGNQRDRPSLELLSTLDIELVYCTDDVIAESVIAEIIADAGAGLIAIDIETAARLEYANPVPSAAHRTRPADEGAAEAERQGCPRPASLRAAPHPGLRRRHQGRGPRHALGVLVCARAPLGAPAGQPQRDVRARRLGQARHPPAHGLLDAGRGSAVRGGAARARRCVLLVLGR